MPNLDDLSDLFESMEKTSRNHGRQTYGTESIVQESDILSELGSDARSTTTMSSSDSSRVPGKKTRKYERINTDGLSEKEVNDIRKSRKRQQNRVSSLKCRQRKKTYVSQLEDKTRGVVGENTRLCIENATLKTENDLLRRQLKYFEDLVVNMKNGSNRSVVLPSLEVGLANLSGSSHESHEKQGSGNPQATYKPHNSMNINLDEQVDDFFSPAPSEDLRRDEPSAEEDFTALIQGGNRFSQRPVFMMGVVLCISLAIFGFSGGDEVEFGDHFATRGGIKPLSVEESESPFTSNSLKFYALVISFILAIVGVFTFGRDSGIKASQSAMKAVKLSKKKGTAKTTKID